MHALMEPAFQFTSCLLTSRVCGAQAVRHYFPDATDCFSGAERARAP